MVQQTITHVSLFRLHTRHVEGNRWVSRFHVLLQQSARENKCPDQAAMLKFSHWRAKMPTTSKQTNGPTCSENNTTAQQLARRKHNIISLETIFSPPGVRHQQKEEDDQHLCEEDPLSPPTQETGSEPHTTFVAHLIGIEPECALR